MFLELLLYKCILCADRGGLAQLARALALQARGHRFESDILHQKLKSFFFKNFMV